MGVRLPGEIPLAFDATTQRLWLWAGAGAYELRARNIDTLNDVVVVPWQRAAGDVIDTTPRVVVSAGVAWAALRGGALEFRRLSDGELVDRFDDVFVERNF